MPKPDPLYHPSFPDLPLSECIGKIRDMISWVVKEYAKVSYGTYLEAAKSALARDRVHAMDALSERFPEIDEDELRRLRVADACILLIGAEEAFRAGETESAWFRCAQAKYQLGLYEGLFRNPYSSAERTDFATSGGHARGERTDPVRDELAKLITTMRPPEGWEDIRQIARKLEKPLFLFSEKKGGFLLESNLRQNIRRWLRNRDYRTLQDALKRNLKRGAKPH